MDHNNLAAIEFICQRLSERRATLFLGAGANTTAVNQNGEACPAGQTLADLICQNLLNSSDVKISLDEAAEIARQRVGPKELNKYLYGFFKSFAPSPLHLSLVQLPWDSVFTTNYDLLVEDAAAAASVKSAGSFRPIFSLTDDLSPFSEDDILYYKLHGSIDVANTDEGRLILTKEDYRYYEEHRKPLFRRLKANLINHTFVFVGYSLSDDNFRAILEDCRNELGTATFPRSFAIRRSAADIQKTFWRDKYNIETLDLDASVFMNLLKGTWVGQNLAVVPFDARTSDQYIRVDDSTSFEKVGESFYRVTAEECSSISDPSAFFKGGEPKWGDIRAKIAPLRDGYFTLLEGMFEELLDAGLNGSVYVVTGAAGTGKTTLLRSLAFDLANDTDCVVLYRIPSTPFDAKCLGPLVETDANTRIVIFIPHAAESPRLLDDFVNEVRQLKMPVTFVLEERRNQWNNALSRHRMSFTPVEIEIGKLSDGEVREVLSALKKHDALDKLTGASDDQLLTHFEEVAHLDLLVALRELTTQNDFDKIVIDEYSKIPTEVGKSAYVYVSALGQLDLPIRFETLQHLLSITLEEFGSQVVQTTEGVLISLEDFGQSRHNAGFRLETRHPTIASLIFGHAAADDEAKFQVINAIIEELDPGYNEDKRILEGITRRKQLVGTLASPHMRRAVYERLAKVLPGDPYVLQHRSILEKDLGDAEKAVDYARRAVGRDGKNPAFKSTLGFALEFAARTATTIQREAMLAEGARLFEAGIKSSPYDPYSYLGKAAIIRQRIERETDGIKKRELQASLLSLFEEAFEETGESSMIAGELAKQKDIVGEPDVAIGIVRESLTKVPSDERLRNLLIRMEGSRGNYQNALTIALQGEKYDPTAWRIQRSIARLKRHLGHPVAAIRGYYDAALRHNQGDPSLIAEYGAFLFANGDVSEANVIFNKGHQLKVPNSERTMVREHWQDADGGKKVFAGKVSDIRGGVGYVMAVPENFTAIYWRSHQRWVSLKKNDAVRFTVGFTAQGPKAELR